MKYATYMTNSKDGAALLLRCHRTEKAALKFAQGWLKNQAIWPLHNTLDVITVKILTTLRSSK